MPFKTNFEKENLFRVASLDQWIRSTETPTVNKLRQAEPPRFT